MVHLANAAGQAPHCLFVYPDSFADDFLAEAVFLPVEDVFLLVEDVFLPVEFVFLPEEPVFLPVEDVFFLEDPVFFPEAGFFPAEGFSAGSGGVSSPRSETRDPSKPLPEL